MRDPLTIKNIPNIPRLALVLSIVEATTLWTYTNAPSLFILNVLSMPEIGWTFHTVQIPFSQKVKEW